MGPDLLIVDDAPDEVRSLSVMLSSFYRLRFANDGRSAIAAAQVRPPSLILLDVVMPDMDGFSVCRILKAEARTRATPILFLSAYASEDFRLRGFRAGGVDYIEKPFVVEEVQARIQVHLARQPSAGVDERPAGLDDFPPALRAAITHILDHLGSLPPAKVIAMRAGVDESELRDMFRNRLGTTFSRFAFEQRMRLARELLTATVLPVRDVAAATGYASPANFSTAFRDRMGITPLAFRQAANGEHA